MTRSVLRMRVVVVLTTIVLECANREALAQATDPAPASSLGTLTGQIPPDEVVYVTDAADYRARLRALGDAWRRHLGAHYPAVALFEVAGLFDPAARVELVGTAVVSDP